MPQTLDILNLVIVADMYHLDKNSLLVKNLDYLINYVQNGPVTSIIEEITNEPIVLRN